MDLLTSSVAFRPQQKEATRFAEKYTLEQRTSQSAKIRDKFSDHVPVILEPAPEKRASKTGKSFQQQLDDGQLKTKYLVPSMQSVAKFTATVRKQVKLSKEEALYLMTLDNTIPAATMTMSQLDKNHRSPDGFLYLVFAGENTFGSRPISEK